VTAARELNNFGTSDDDAPGFCPKIAKKTPKFFVRHSPDYHSTKYGEVVWLA
jgi:hypothetical protein